VSLAEHQVVQTHPQWWTDLDTKAVDTARVLAMDASASRSVRFEQFGFTPDRVVAAAHATLDRVGKISSTISGT
jgi:transketolase